MQTTFRFLFAAGVLFTLAHCGGDRFSVAYTSVTADGNTTANTNESKDPQKTVSPASSPTESELAECQKRTGEKSKFKVIHQNQEIKVGDGEGIALKIAGNKTHVELQLGSSEGAKMGSVCLILQGNQSSIEVKTDAKLANLLLLERGNLPRATFDFGPDASVEGIFAVALFGNRPVVKIVGKKICPRVFQRGNQPSVSCQ